MPFSLETVVALLRNGLCVCVDTLPSTHRLKSPLKALLAEWRGTPEPILADTSLGGRLHELSPLSIVIAALQLGAVYFNTVGALLGLPAAYAAWRSARRTRASVSMKARSRVASAGAEAAVARASTAVAFGVVRLFLGPSFFVLALYTLKAASQHVLEVSLLMMQIALGLALWAMRVEIAARRKTADDALFLAAADEEEADQGLLSSSKLPSAAARSSSDTAAHAFDKAAADPARYLAVDAARLLQNYASTTGGNTHQKPKNGDVLGGGGGSSMGGGALASSSSDDATPLVELVADFYTGSVGFDDDKLRARCDAWLSRAAEAAATRRAELRDFSKREFDALLLDEIVYWLNVVAFAGYLVFPATYFGPFERDPGLEWLGNFAGDLAWTLEPALVIVSALIAKLGLRKGLAGTASKPKAE